MLDFDGSARLETFRARWRDRVVYVRSDAKDRLELSAVLIRPDGIVAWVAGEGFTSPDLKQMEALYLGA